MRPVSGTACGQGGSHPADHRHDRVGKLQSHIESMRIYLQGAEQNLERSFLGGLNMLRELFTIKDERLKAQNHKICSEGFYIILGLLFASYLIKSVFLNIPMREYWTEFAIFMIGAVYTTVRHVLNGTFTLALSGKNASEKKRVYYIIISIVSGVATGIGVGLRNYFAYGFDSVMIIFVVLPIMCFMTPLVYLLLYSLDRSASKRADKIAGEDRE